jgi:general secretion pathway protein A
MYESHWRLTEAPFENRADVSFYFPAATHHGALLKLRYLVEHGKGLAILASDHGAGKTFLTHVLERELDAERYLVRRLLYPHLSSEELLGWFARAIGVDIEQAGQHRDGILDALEAELRQLSSEDRHPVLMIDEAHLLEVQHLQTLQLLLNYQQDPEIQFSLILVGQPELLPRVKRVGGLEARVAVRTTLTPLGIEECGEYVRHRMEIAGCPESPFSEATMATIHDLSQGVPRRINQLCDLALLIGFADELTSVSAVEIQSAAEELSCVSAS